MQKQIKNIISHLNNGHIILYPTDTIYGIGCDATSEESVRKIFKIKNRKETKSLIILVNSMEMLQEYVLNIPKEIIKYLENTKTPTTVIYQNPINIAKNCIAKDNTVAIRIINKGFVNELITAYKKPIVSTSANISGAKSPKTFDDVSNEIKDAVDYIVPVKKDQNSLKPSKIVRFVHNKIVVLRD